MRYDYEHLIPSYMCCFFRLDAILAWRFRAAGEYTYP